MGDSMTSRYERGEVLTKGGHLGFTEVEKVLEMTTELCMDVQRKGMKLENPKLGEEKIVMTK
jgi:hypothetical protein